MANGHGGARTPAKPAPVSGPGALSARTDGTPAQQHKQALLAPTGLDYGDHKAEIDELRTAPIAKAVMPTASSTPTPMPQGAPGASGTAGGTPYQSGAFHAPSTRPQEPVTSGAAIGPGAGPEAMTLPQGSQATPTGALTQTLQQLSATDTTGVLAQLYQLARARGV